jgi:hypothetical protein
MSSEAVLSVLRSVFLVTSAGILLVSILFLGGVLAARPMELDVSVLIGISAAGAVVSWYVFLRH